MLRMKTNPTLIFLMLLSLYCGHLGLAYGYYATDEEQDDTPTVAPLVYGPFFTPSVAPVEMEQPILKYEVQKGDTLYQIANDIRNPRLLAIGKLLIIPANDAPLSLPDGNQQVKRVLNTTLTAYTAGIESTGKTPSNPLYGITYSGIRAEEGRTIAVDPTVIPLGATVFIDGIGLRTAEDTGSAIRGSRIDVFMNDFGEAVAFGVKKNVKVYVLEVL
jgi:3D (Asp-Asp-Asp) domain-containing protein